MRVSAIVSLLSITAAWLLVSVDPRANDGFSGIFMLVGIPALCIAVMLTVFGFFAVRGAETGGRWLWWPLLVMPLGVLGALAVLVLRVPDYFIGDDSPWALLAMPVFVVIGMLLGPLIWFFTLFPIAQLIRGGIAMSRGEAKATVLILPLVLLALGVLVLVGAGAVDTGLSGRLAYPALIAAFFGLPGDYEVVWEPGLWIVRGIVLAIVPLFAVPAVVARLRRPADPPA